MKRTIPARPAISRRITTMALTVAALAVISGCAALRQFAALRQVDFSFDRVSDVRLAGVTVAGKDSYDDLSVADIAKIATAVADHDVPLDFVVHVRAENPASNSVTARLVELDWTFFLEENRIVDGEMDQAFSFEPGKPVDVPVGVAFDGYDVAEESAKDLFELALAIAGVGGFEKEVRLDLEPTVETELGRIRYPNPVTVRRSVGNTTD